jgi:hypothetical protein
MKKPREILLARHQGMLPKLDAIRRAARAEVTAPHQSLWREFLLEWILPYRPLWAGLAAVWVAVLALRLATSAAPAPVTMVQRVPAADMARLVQDDRQMVAEVLLGKDRPLAKPPGSKPRTGLRVPSAGREEEVRQLA